MGDKNQLHKIEIDLKGKKKPVTIIVCDDWPYTRVGVSVKVPISGSPAQKEFITTCAHLSMNKNANRLIRAHMHGYRFNAVAQRMNVRDFKYTETRGADGAPESFIVQCWSKPHMAGKALAILCSMFFNDVSGTDTSYPWFGPISRQRDHVEWGCYQLKEFLLNNGELAITVAKPNMIKDKWPDQFKTNFTAKAKDVKSKGKVYDSKDVPPFNYGPMKTITFDLKSPKDEHSALFLTQIIGRPVTLKNNKLSFVLLEIEETWEMRRIRNICRSEGAITRMVGVFTKFTSEKDRNPTKSESVSLAMVANAEHLPISYVNSLAKSSSLPDEKKIHKDLSGLFA